MNLPGNFRQVIPSLPLLPSCNVRILIIPPLFQRQHQDNTREAICVPQVLFRYLLSLSSSEGHECAMYANNMPGLYPNTHQAAI